MKQFVRAALGLLIGGLLVWLLFRGTDWSELAAAIRGVDPGWLIASQLVLWGSCFTRVQRWSYVVRAVAPASFRQMLSATQIGFLVNFTVPARIGELVRGYMLSRLAGIPLARSIAMVALDRVNDVIGLLAVLLVASLALAADARVELPAAALGNTEPLAVSSELVRATAWALGGLAIVALTGLAMLHARRELVLGAVRTGVAWLSEPLAERLGDLLEGFAAGLAVFRSRSDLARSLGWSLITWGANVATLALLLEAFSVEFAWYTPFVMLALIAVFISVPLTPGVVGQYHLPAVAALLMTSAGTSPATAKAVAIVAHISTLLPIGTLGLYCLFRERVGLRDVVRQTAESRSGARPTDPGPMR